MHESEEQSNPGGLAPADRQCHYTKSDGHPCRDWTLRGHHHCFRHLRSQRCFRRHYRYRNREVSILRKPSTK